ncbi:hypothetical protein C8J57DRAFT_475122 [Mycena rebaudengoi]|nr:hypothetical protein C8J57DRAFT_475122 [Mycena rebaudengoi]
MHHPNPRSFFLYPAVLSSVTAARAPAGQKMIFGMQPVVNGTYFCLLARSDLSVTVNGCKDQPETMAWAVTSGSAASTTPPLGTITHQYVPWDDSAGELEQVPAFRPRSSSLRCAGDNLCCWKHRPEMDAGAEAPRLRHSWFRAWLN